VLNMRLVLAAVPMFVLQGCVASVVGDVMTKPVRVVSKVADVLTTSQSESDEKRGRELRKREENIGKLSRQRDKARERCADGDKGACKKAADISEQIADKRDRSY
jgi:hypothetical protein